jgi:hypothetical protein
LLRRAGREDSVMRRVQDQFFDDAYLLPAMAWAAREQFTLPLPVFLFCAKSICILIRLYL